MRAGFCYFFTDMNITIEYDRNHPQLQDCPAGTYRYTGLIIINPDLFDLLTPFQKKFTILHEKGHINLETDDEVEADAYAFDRLAGTEFRSMKQCLEFLEKLLVPGLPSTDKRIAALYERALEWDNRH